MFRFLCMLFVFIFFSGCNPSASDEVSVVSLEQLIKSNKNFDSSEVAVLGCLSRDYFVPDNDRIGFVLAGCEDKKIFIYVVFSIDTDSELIKSSIGHSVKLNGFVTLDNVASSNGDTEQIITLVSAKF